MRLAAFLVAAAACGALWAFDAHADTTYSVQQGWAVDIGSDSRGKLFAEAGPGGALKREYIYLGDIPVGMVQ